MDIESIEDAKRWRKSLRDPDFVLGNNTYQNGVMFYGASTLNGRPQAGFKRGKPIHNIEAALFWREQGPAEFIPILSAEPAASDYEAIFLDCADYANELAPSTMNAFHHHSQLSRRQTLPSFSRSATAGSSDTLRFAREIMPRFADESTQQPVPKTPHSVQNPHRFNESGNDDSHPPAEVEFNQLNLKIRVAMIQDITEDDEIRGLIARGDDRFITARALLRVTKGSCHRALQENRAVKTDDRKRKKMPNRNETVRGLLYLQRIRAPLSLLNLWTLHHNIDISKYKDINDGLYDDLVMETE